MRLLLLVLGLVAVLQPGVATVSAQDAQVSAEQQLVDRYVPIAYVREQERACATPPRGGEPYLPVPVEMVIGNERVLIRDAANRDEVVGTGPDAAGLATFGPDTYMDFPGDPRRPGCTYETDERLRSEELGLKPTTYARVVFDAEEQRLALQYWFYWYFNDWNNTHESDWEMIQLMWDEVGGVEEALGRLPDRIGYSQHGNGELAKWGDPKLELEDDTHPLVYPAAGSHATFFSDETFLAWGERNSGFGCDVSTGPAVRTPLEAILVPDEIDPQGEFAWILYEGRWGERQRGSFNGPVGPGLNGRWIDPWEATDNWRPVSIVVPGSQALGPTMTDAFCGITESGSRALLYTMANPWIGIPALLIGVGVLSFFVYRSRRYFAEATRLYLTHWRVFVGIGLIAIPIGILFNIIQAFLINRDPLEYVVEWFNDTAGARLTAIAAIGGFQQLAMLLIIAPAVVQAVADIHRGQEPSVLRSYRFAALRALPIAQALVIIILVVGIPALIIIGLPIAIWLLVRWQFFMQSIVLDRQRTSIDALTESAHLVRNRWWSTLGKVFIFDLLATIPGILVGFGLLTLGRAAVGLANSVSSLLYALTIPLAVIALTLLYLERKEPQAQTGGPKGTDS